MLQILKVQSSKLNLQWLKCWYQSYFYEYISRFYKKRHKYFLVNDNLCKKILFNLKNYIAIKGYGKEEILAPIM